MHIVATNLNKLLKFSLITLPLLLGITTLAAKAEITEAPQLNQVYNDFVKYDGNGSKNISLQPNTSGTYTFNAGAFLDNSATDTGHSIFVPLQESNIGTNIDIVTGTNKTLKMKTNRFGAVGILDYKNKSSVNFKGGKILINNGDESNIFDTASSSFNSQSGKITVNAESFTIQYDSTIGKNKLGAIQGHTSEGLDFNLSDDFLLNNVAIGVALQNSTHLNIKANNISINTVTSQGQKYREYNDSIDGSGLYFLYGSIANIQSVNDINITSAGYGSYTYNSTNTLLSEHGNVNIKSNEYYAIYAGGDTDTGTYSTNTIKAAKDITLFGEKNALKASHSKITLDAGKSATLQSNNSALYAMYGCTDTIKAAQDINIIGKTEAIYAHKSNISLEAKNITLTAALTPKSSLLYAFNRTNVNLSSTESLIASNSDDGSDVRYGSKILIKSPVINWTTDASSSDWSIFASNTDYADSYEPSIFNFNEDGNFSTINTAGLMKASTEGEIYLKAGKDSNLKHHALVDDSGIFEISLKDNATWHMPLDNSVTLLHFDNGGTISFDHHDNFNSAVTNSLHNLNNRANTGTPIYRNLTTQELSGSNGTIELRMDLCKDSDITRTNDPANDQIDITGKAEGTHKVIIDFQNPADPDSSKMFTNNYLISQGAGSDMTLINTTDGSNVFSGNGMVSKWKLVFVADGSNNKLADSTFRDTLKNEGQDKGQWILVRDETTSNGGLPTPDPTPDPDTGGDNSTPSTPDPDPVKPVKPTIPWTDIEDTAKPIIPWTDIEDIAKPIKPFSPLLPAEAIDQIELGSALALASTWYAEESDLRERLGEIRYGTQEGVWARVDTRKETLSHHFEQKTYGLHIGYDTLVGTSEKSSWLLGGALRYSEADQSKLESKSSGETTQYSAKLYGTWMHREGCYADFVLQAGHYKQSIHGIDNVGTGFTDAEYDTNGFGLSVEIGHAFTFGAETDDRPWQNHFFIEPQLQLSYFHSQGADYTSTTGLAVNQESANFLSGRAGIVIGKKFNFGDWNSLDKRYLQLEFKTGIEHEFESKQTIHLTGIDGVRASSTVEDMFGDRYYYGFNMNAQIAERTHLYGSFEYIKGDEYCQDYEFTLGLKYLF